jgi:hypothetical protein
MLKENYAMLKRKIWITTKFTSRQGFSDLSPPNRTSCLAQSSQGASLALIGDLGFTSYDGELDDDPFFFHTCLVGEVDFDVGDLSFTGSLFLQFSLLLYFPSLPHPLGADSYGV